MTPTTVAELVAQSEAAVQADLSWLGSQAQLDLLEAYVRARCIPKAVVWGLTGSDWDRQTQTMTLERLKPGAVADPVVAARHIALNALHETLHARHSTDPAADAFLTKVGLLKKMNNAGGAILGTVFNRLEDERIMRAELAVSLDDIAALEEYRDEVVAQRTVEYEERLGEPLWSTAATHKGEQYMTALQVRIHRPALVGPVHKNVATVLSSAEPLVETAINGSMMDAVTSSEELLRLFSNSLTLLT